MLDAFKVGWGVNRSCCDFVHRLFFKGALSLYRCYRCACVQVPVFIHESLSMGSWPIKSLIDLHDEDVFGAFRQSSSLAGVEHVGAVTKVSDQNTLEPDELVDVKPTLIPNCQRYCLSVVLQVLVSLTIVDRP